MVVIGCISRSRGKKIGFQNVIYKNLLVGQSAYILTFKNCNIIYFAINIEFGVASFITTDEQLQ